MERKRSRRNKWRQERREVVRLHRGGLDGAVQNRLRSRLKGATVEDLAFLIAHEELKKHVYV